jgi:hypothetical protein
MMFEELKEAGKIDSENNLKETVLTNSQVDLKKWEDSFELYIDEKFPKLSLKNVFLKKSKSKPKGEIIYNKCKSKMSTFTLISFLIFEVILLFSVFYYLIKRKY